MLYQIANVLGVSVIDILGIDNKIEMHNCPQSMVGLGSHASQTIHTDFNKEIANSIVDILNGFKTTIDLMNQKLK